MHVPPTANPFQLLLFVLCGCRDRLLEFGVNVPDFRTLGRCGHTFA